MPFPSSLDNLPTNYVDGTTIYASILNDTNASVNRVQAALLGGLSLLDKGGSLFNVKSFGAVGNGTTDDTSAINAALSAASGPSGTVYFPAGTYLATAQLNLTTQSVLGQGMLATTLRRGQAGGYFFGIASGGPGLSIRNLTIDGNYPTYQPSSGEISNSGVADLLIEYVRIRQFNSAAVVISAARTTVQHCVITGVSASGHSSFGVWNDSSSANGARILHNVISGCDLNAVFAGGSGTLVEGNYCFGNALANGGQLTHGPTAVDLKILGNTILAGLAGASGIEIASVNGVLVANNSITGQARYGIVTELSPHDVVIANNLVKNCHQAGIYLAASGGGNTQVIGNRCTDDQSTKTQPYGLDVASGCGGNLMVTGNDFTGNLTGAIRDQASESSRIYRGNRGYNPVGHLSVAGVGASGSVTTNGLGVDATVFITGGVLTGVSIGGTPTGITSTPVVVRVPAGQTIAVSYTSAPSWSWFGD